MQRTKEGSELTFTGAEQREEECEGVVCAIESAKGLCAYCKTSLLHTNTFSHT